jgi:glycosyltransferase involved in cell wall biosynthesis
MSGLEAQMNKIIALIPAYNEENHIASVVQGARGSLPVIVVDDGSFDRTPELAAAAGAEVLIQNPNQGKGAALRAGFRRALEQGCDAAVMLDADGQHDPAEIPAFLEIFSRTEADLVIGARDFKRMPLVRRAGNTIGRVALSWAMGQIIRDNQSGYRLLSRRMMEVSMNLREGGFEFEVEMVVECVRRGWRLEWVPIRTIYADEKSHIRAVSHVLNFFRLVLKARAAVRGR